MILGALVANNSGDTVVLRNPGLFIESTQNGRFSGRLISLTSQLSGVVGASYDVQLRVDGQLITTVEFPNLTLISGGALILLRYNTLLVDAQFPLLATLSDGNLYLDGISGTPLTSLSFPSLTTFSGFSTLSATDNSHLSNISLPVLRAVADGSDFELSGCALSQACVNNLLTTINNAKEGTGTLVINGGTSAAPSGTGITAKNALVSAGWTVTTN